MKNKIIALTAIMAIALSMAGCGNKTQSGSQINGNNTAATQAADGATAAPKTEEQVKDELDNFAKDADKNVDMDKIEGTELELEEDAKKDFDGYEVEIEDAVKTKDADGSDVVVVELEFKNKTSLPTKFSSVLSITASQEEKQIPFALTYEAEGYEILALAQDVDTNEKIKVQRAFKLVSDSEPVTISVRKTDTIGGSEPLTATFNLK